jgi:transcriptional regulator with XRE-family HTH domain
MQNKEQFNNVVAQNIVKYRKYHNLTQASLAEKLNYSDKAVAKWESGESLPDAYVLYQLSQIFGITLNDLLSQKKRAKMPVNKLRSIIIPLLADCIVWLVTLLTFVTLSAVFEKHGRFWLCFITAVPLSFILFLVFSSIYKNPLFQFISITGIIWSTLVTLHLYIIDLTPVSYYVYYIGIPIQIAFTLVYGYLFIPKLKRK